MKKSHDILESNKGNSFDTLRKQLSIIESFSKKMNLYTSNFNKFDTIALQLSNIDNKILQISNLYKIISENQNVCDRLSSIIENNGKIFKESLNDELIKDNYKKLNLYVLNSYINTFEKYINKSIKNTKYDEILNIIQNNTFNRLAINSIIEKNIKHDVNEKIVFEFTTDDTIIQYLGYSFRENSNTSFETEYDKYYLDEVSSLGRIIIEKINKINELYNLVLDSDFFEYNMEMTSLAVKITYPTKNKLEFSDLLSNIYKSIYEGSGGDNNKIYNLLPDNETLTLIKHFRQYFEHSSTKTKKKRVNNVNLYLLKVLGTTMPTKWNEFVKLQVAIYRDIDGMLTKIYVEIEEQYKNKV